ncbi:TPA: hypothetical protein ACGCCX_001525 [Acinetobacter nosocomialis]
MLQVHAKFEDDLHTENMLKTSQIPCLCKIAEKFEIHFLVAYPQVTGFVTGWEYKEIDLRVSAGAGGEYLHYKYGLITLSKLEKDLYIIENLSMFESGSGWLPVVENREYSHVAEVEEPDWLKDL